MKAKILLSVIVSAVLLMAPCAFAQQAGQDDNAPARFQNTPDREGCDIIPGGVAVAEGRHPAGSQASAVEPVFDPFTEALVRDLTARGFQVNPGYPILYEEDACAKYTYTALQSCFGNNPVSPYVIPLVKAWPNEYVGPTPVNTFGEVQPGYIPTYRLDRRDAVVIYGQMPPPGKYMSLVTYEWSRHGRWKAKDYNQWANTPNHPPMRYVFSTIPPDDPKSGRIWTFSTLGESVDNVAMQQKSGKDPFGKDRYFIITPSAMTDQAVRRVLQAQGVPDDDIFTEEIPSRDDLGPIGPLGMGENAIDFWTLFKYAIPDDQDAAQQWWDSFKGDNPMLKVMRVRAPSSLGPVQRYDLLTYDERTAISEAYLADDLQNLVNAVCDRVGSTMDLYSADCTEPPPASSFMADPLLDFGWAGPYCRKVNMWCGDQPDAGLFFTGPLPLDGEQVYAVVATLATETGNATYVGLSVNDASTYLSPGGVTGIALKGSADGYAGTVNNTDKFFVHYFTRDCTRLEEAHLLWDRPQDCTEITEDMVPKKGDTNAIGDPTLFGMFWPGIRDYIAPGTARGPDTAKLLTPRILMFTQP